MRMNGLLSPATIRLGKLAGGWVPTGVVDTMEEAASRSGGRCVVAREPETIVRPPFEGVPQDLPPLEPATDTEIPRIAVDELPSGRVLGKSRAVVTGTGDLLWELSHYFGARSPREHPVFNNPFPGAPLEVSGRLGVLASRGDSNYYHFLIDVLPRIGVLEQAPDVAPPDRWYVPVQTRFQREMLELIGITPDVRIDSDEHPHVRAETLVVPGLPSVVKEKNPPWVVDFLRRRLMKDITPATERRPLYVARTAGSHNRTIVDEPALIRLLEARGFQTIDPGAVSVTAQIEAFASASVIVSAHGAALANLVFATPGATVIELFPAGSTLPDYWRLASSAGVRYRYLSAWPGGGADRRNRSTTIVSDIEVDLAALEAMLDAVSS
jgi:capsular polysaccharide biosynthesis protein